MRWGGLSQRQEETLLKKLLALSVALSTKAEAAKKL